MMVTLYKNDFSYTAWFYLLREFGIIESTKAYQEIYQDEDEYGFLLPEYEDMFTYSAFIELEVTSVKKNF